MNNSFSNHLVNKRLYFKSPEENSECSIEELIDVLNKDSLIDTEIASKFIFSGIGSNSELISVGNSKDLVSTFKEIRNEKLDIIEKFENIKYIGINDKGEIILEIFNESVDPEPISISGIYNFKSDLTDDIFHMGKYTNFCIEEDYQDILKENLVLLFEKMRDKEYQYRLIKDNGTWYVRTVTSVGYKKYDNSCAIYLMLYMLNSQFVKTGDKYYLQRLELSDSLLDAYFEPYEEKVIEGVGKLKVGYLFSNGEIKNSYFSCSLRMTIEDSISNEKITITQELDNSVYKIPHSTGVNKFLSYIRNFEKSQVEVNNMCEYIRDIKSNNMVTSNIVYYAMSRLTSKRNDNISKNTKELIRNLYESDLIRNTESIITSLGKILKVAADIEERISIERIYYSILLEQKKKNK